MNQKKTRRIAAGATVAGVLLIIFLAIILIVQFVQIGVAKKRQSALAEEKTKYEQMIAEDQSDLDFYKTQAGLFYLARKEGWR